MSLAASATDYGSSSFSSFCQEAAAAGVISPVVPVGEILCCAVETSMGESRTPVSSAGCPKVFVNASSTLHEANRLAWGRSTWDEGRTVAGHDHVGEAEQPGARVME